MSYLEWQVTDFWNNIYQFLYILRAHNHFVSQDIDGFGWVTILYHVIQSTGAPCYEIDLVAGKKSERVLEIDRQMDFECITV